jgi:hypothetical protein
MIKDPEASADIKETDIVFDCPHCGKSLAIDYRGAGLTINCSDCAKDVQVPIPDGMEIEDIDSTSEEQEVRIMHLRKLLAASHGRVQALEGAVEELTARRESLEKGRAENMYRLGEILEKMGVLEAALKTAAHAVEDVSAICKPEDD